MRRRLDRAYARQRLLSFRRGSLRRYAEWAELAVWAAAYLTVAAALVISTFF